MGPELPLPLTELQALKLITVGSLIGISIAVRATWDEGWWARTFGALLGFAAGSAFAVILWLLTNGVILLFTT